MVPNLPLLYLLIILRLGERFKVRMSQKRKTPSNFRDLTGMKFGTLTVIKRVDKPAHLKKDGVYWLCKCDCGNERIVLACNLTTGHTTNCGCVQRRKTSERCLRDLTGMRFGRLIVIKRAENYVSPKGDTNTQWLCLCDCGEYVTVNQSRLTSGNTQSCGCLRREKSSERKFDDLTSKRFGKLTVLRRVEDLAHPNGTFSVQWLCRCDCGNQVIVTAGNLRNKHTVSCGCISSKNEATIAKILRKYKVKYKQQYTFDDCKDVGLLRFDFGVLDNNNELVFLIEYDGEQHYEPIKFSDMSDEEVQQKLLETQHRDQIKNDYCRDNGIPLLRIPYWEKDNLENILVEHIKDFIRRGLLSSSILLE